MFQYYALTSHALTCALLRQRPGRLATSLTSLACLPPSTLPRSASLANAFDTPSAALFASLRLRVSSALAVGAWRALH